jgi:acetyl esterase/lipase
MTLPKRVLVLAVGLFAAVATTPAQEKAPPKATNLQTVFRVPEGTKVLKDLAYVPNGGPRQTLDLYLPAKADGPLPLVIWVHGGAWRGGSKDGANPALALLPKGFAVASINYRLSQHAVFPAQIEDCKAAVRWLRSHAKEYNLDAGNFGAWGASAGGHLVALLGTTDDTTFPPGGDTDKTVSSRVQAVCDWFGPSDFLHWGATGSPAGGSEADSAISRLLGGPVPEKKELAARASPVTHVGKSAAPFLILHGDEDKTVPLQQSEVLAEALKKAGVETTLYVVKGNGHGGPGFIGPEARQMAEAFFAKHLTNGTAAGK